MKQLKEALIGKNNFKNAELGTRDDNVVWILKPYYQNISDILDLFDVEKTTTFDNLEVYVMIQKDLKKYWKDICQWDCVTAFARDPKMTVSQACKYLQITKWEYSKLTKKFSFVGFDEMVEEALVGNHNSKNASSKEQDLYLVNPYNEYYDYLHDTYLEYEFSQTGVFIIDERIIKKMIKTLKKSNRISSYINVYPLTGFDKKMLSDLENDLQDTDDINDGILDAYGLVKIDINDLL